MIPKGLVIGVVSGVFVAAVFGIIVTTLNNQNQQLVFVEGPSLAVVTEKKDFELGENISIRIVNSGTEPLTFSDASYGLEIRGLDGSVLYSPVSAQVISVLQPEEEQYFVWDQTKNDGTQVIQGTYRIASSGVDADGNTVKKSLTINIHK